MPTNHRGKGQGNHFPKPRYRIPHRAAHVQVIKHRPWFKEVDITPTAVRNAFKTRWLSRPQLFSERRNGTARLMSKAQVRKTLAFAKREDEKLRLGWWGVTIYKSASAFFAPFVHRTAG